MKNIKIKETIYIHNMHKCDPQDLIAVSDLIGNTHTFLKIQKHKERQAKAAATLCHSAAILDAIYVILCSYFGHVDKFSLITCLFIVLYCGKNGFDFNKIANALKIEQNEIAEQYNTVKNIIEKVPASQIHNIAEIYRTKCPDKNKLNLDDIKTVIRDIVIKYER